MDAIKNTRKILGLPGFSEKTFEIISISGIPKLQPHLRFLIISLQAFAVTWI
jgi:hypothetical protein